MKYSKLKFSTDKKCVTFPQGKLNRSALSVATLFVLGSTPLTLTGALAATVTIGPDDTQLFSQIWGTSTGQTQTWSEIKFNGTSANPSTLVFDTNTTSTTPNEWNLNLGTPSYNVLAINSGKYGVIQLQDGINLKLSNASYGVIATNSSTSKIVFDVGRGSTLSFENNYFQNSANGAIYTYSDLVFKGDQGTVVFNNNSSDGWSPAITAENANVIFEGNASFTNNKIRSAAGATIRTYTSGNIIFSGHDAMVLIANNLADSSGGGLFSDGTVELYGNADIYNNRGRRDTAGAIVAQRGLILVSNGTYGIKIHDNYSNIQSAGAVLIGNNTGVTGANLLHAVNSDIQFYNNRTQTGSGTTPNLTNAVS